MPSRLAIMTPTCLTVDKRGFGFLIVGSIAESMEPSHILKVDLVQHRSGGGGGYAGSDHSLIIIQICSIGPQMGRTSTSMQQQKFYRRKISEQSNLFEVQKGIIIGFGAKVDAFLKRLRGRHDGSMQMRICPCVPCPSYKRIVFPREDASTSKTMRSITGSVLAWFEEPQD
ncbi:hypothetical protein TNCV_697351 [Trichonephila clavipes]|nr:hypothetical protein TNCV_697351 [Trichonephila clavipes]